MQKRTLMVNEDTGSFSNQGSYDEMSSAIDRETLKRKLSEEQDFSESETEIQLPKKPSNGKKTKGRVKIKMEFIDNKLRRYTTFSKRKTGIMKKAYELSTLTGTQVMVLVASETGHVYTFATRKLQPMITSEAGKCLIQTCLNSPDPLLEASSSSPDQRMSAAGYEETEFSYNVDDIENKIGIAKTLSLNQNGSTSTASIQSVAVSSAVGNNITSLPSPLPNNITTIPLFTSTTLGTSSNNNNGSVPTTPPALSMQLPQGGFTTILTPGATIPQASALQIGTLQSSQNQVSSNQQVSSNSQSPLLRISPALVSLPAVVTTTSTTKQVESPVTVVPTSRPNVSVVPGNVILPTSSITPTSTGVPNAVMYQAPPGVVYAPSSSLPERIILNLSLQSDQGQQLYMPLPVSLTPANQKVTGTLTAKVALASISSPFVADKSQKCRK